MKSARRFAPRFLAIALASSTVWLWASPGFGTFRKKNLELQTRQPALIRLANATIAFKGSSTNTEYASVEGSLLASLETELVSNEKSLVKKENPADAEWVLSLKVTGFSTPNPQTRTSNASNSGVINYIHWSGSLNAAYQVLDHSGRVHDANNVNAAYDHEFETNQTKGGIRLPSLGRPKKQENAPHSTEDIKQILVKDVVKQIAANLGNTTTTVEVQIAAGDEHLNRAAEFVDQRLWQRAIDELQGASAFLKPDDESYRQYDLGLAYESMAYDSKSGAEQRASIYKAAEFYDKALELNPKEKYFVKSIARTKEAIARYKELDRTEAADKQRKTGEASRVVQQKTIRIGDVVAMYSAGVPEDVIIESVRAAPVDFNPLDPDTLILISKAKLPIPIQNELRKKVGAPLLPVPSK